MSAGNVEILLKLRTGCTRHRGKFKYMTSKNDIDLLESVWRNDDNDWFNGQEETSGI